MLLHPFRISSMLITRPGISDNQSGFTIAELLIALVINVVILMALISIFSTHVSNNTKIQKSNILNQQLETALELMANDIRRAGYWGNSTTDIGTNANNNP